MSRLFRLNVIVKHRGDWSEQSNLFPGVYACGLFYYPVKPGEVSLEVIGVYGTDKSLVRGFINWFRALEGFNVVKILNTGSISRQYWRIIYLANYSGVLKYIILNSGGLFINSLVHGGVKGFSAYFLNEGDAEGVCGEFKRRGDVELINCEVSRVRRREVAQLSGNGSLLRHVLTDNEFKVLKLAYEMGYFDTTRRVELGDLAKLLGVSKATVDHHLRSALRKITRLYLDNHLS